MSAHAAVGSKLAKGAVGRERSSCRIDTAPLTIARRSGSVTRPWPAVVGKSRKSQPGNNLPSPSGTKR